MNNYVVMMLAQFYMPIPMLFSPNHMDIDGVFAFPINMTVMSVHLSNTYLDELLSFCEKKIRMKKRRNFGGPKKKKEKVFFLLLLLLV